VDTDVNAQGHFRLKDTTTTSIHITANYFYIRSPQQQGAWWFKFIILWDLEVTYFFMVNSLLTQTIKILQNIIPVKLN